MGIPPGALPTGAPHGGEPMGVAVKVEDGNLARRAGDVVSIEVLRQVGLLAEPLADSLAEYADPPIVDPRGERSGEVRPAFGLR